MRLSTCFVIATIVFVSDWQIACTMEADGVVKQVQGNELSIKPAEAFAPSVGDKVKIFVDVPDVGEAEVGTAEIIRIDDTHVYARVEKSSGKVTAGQIVRAVVTPTPSPPAPPVPVSEPRIVIVKSPTANVMAGAEMVGRVRSGQRLPFTQQNGEWYLVEFQQDGRTIRGWIHSDHVRTATAPVVPLPDESTVIEGWGTLFDPAGGATAVKRGNGVELGVPGVFRDLYPDGSVNAPRILRPAKGDFFVQVKVTSAVNVTGLDLVPDARFIYRAAILTVWQDENNFVRLERSSSGTRPHRWSYQAWNQGKAEVNSVGIVGPDGASYLRIQRKQGTFYAWYRQEADAEWTAMEVHRLGLPDEVQVGVSLINTANQPFTVRFEDFELEQD